ncbi:MAG TPA: polymer-forming cytoskeletal protein [Candidatus Polarisedimenticolia bacterium]|nr:polymer-forming cytoskeletal protein [Candidatus Polarisedimenticolia bacterium]
MLGNRQRPPSAPPPERGITIVDRDVTLVGQIVSDEDVCVRGRIEGNVSSSGLVVIEPHGVVLGDITAENLSVAGEVVGSVVVARRFELSATGRLRGDIRAAVVSISEDAFLQGKVLATEKISTNVRARRSPKPTAHA